MLRFLGTKIGTALLVAVIIVGLAIYAKVRNRAPQLDTAAKVGLIAESSIDRAIESGNLQQDDWEEALRRIQGSSTIDAAIANLTENASTSSTEAPALTATDRFAQRFFTEYVRLQKNGGVIDEETSLRLVNRLLAEDYGSPSVEKTFNMSDISLANGSTASDVRKYANSLASAFTQPSPAGYEHELIIINRVAETENNDDLEKLAQNIARYEQIRSLTAKIPVPSQFVQNHIAILNSLSAIIEGVKGMQLLSSDPVGATKMALRYEDGVNALDLSTVQLSSMIRQLNIKFSPSEAGYIFMN